MISGAPLAKGALWTRARAATRGLRALDFALPERARRTGVRDAFVAETPVDLPDLAAETGALLRPPPLAARALGDALAAACFLRFTVPCPAILLTPVPRAPARRAATTVECSKFLYTGTGPASAISGRLTGTSR